MTFYKVQAIFIKSLKYKKKKINQRQELPLRNHLTCRCCGRTLTGSASRGNGGRYYYYHCKNGCKERFKAKEANKSFAEYLQSLTIKSEVAQAYRAIMKDKFSKEESERRKEKNRIQSDIEGAKQRLLTIDEKYIDGALEQDSYPRLKEHHKRQLTELEYHKLEFETVNEDFVMYLDSSLDLLTNLYGYYIKAPVDLKQKIIGSIFPEKLVFENGRCRTNKVNSVVSLLSSNSKGLGRKKKGQTAKKVDLSYIVNPRGLTNALPT